MTMEHFMDYLHNHRPRRLRHSPAIRALVAETHLSTNDLIAPLFVRHGQHVRIPIASMPSQYQYSIDTLIAEVQQLYQLGIKGVIL